MNLKTICCGEQKNQKRLKICIENHEHDREYIEVDLNETIMQIKQRIFVGKFEPKKSQIYYQRKKLDNQWTIQNCGLAQDCKLYIIYGQNIKE